MDRRGAIKTLFPFINLYKRLLKRNLIIILVTGFALSILGFLQLQQQETANVDPRVVDLFHSDPFKDAALAMAKDDYRFIAVMNHTLFMPKNISACLVEKFGYRVLSNDPIKYMSYSFQLYGSISQTYANFYNFEIWTRLEQEERDQCDR